MLRNVLSCLKGTGAIGVRICGSECRHDPLPLWAARPALHSGLWQSVGTRLPVQKGWDQKMGSDYGTSPFFLFHYRKAAANIAGLLFDGCILANEHVLALFHTMMRAVTVSALAFRSKRIGHLISRLTGHFLRARQNSLVPAVPLGSLGPFWATSHSPLLHRRPGLGRMQLDLVGALSAKSRCEDVRFGNFQSAPVRPREGSFQMDRRNSLAGMVAVIPFC